MMRETKSRPPMKRLQWKCPRSKGRKKNRKKIKPHETNTPLQVVINKAGRSHGNDSKWSIADVWFFKVHL